MNVVPGPLQLSFDLFSHSPEDVLRELRVRGVMDVQRVGFRNNRSRLISLSADRARLNLHDCFRQAPGDVLEAIAAFAAAKRVSPSYRRAIAIMRRWYEAQVGESGDEAPVRSACVGSPEQRALVESMFREFNAQHFSNALPEIPLRLSDRMSRRLGHVQYGRGSVQRSVSEIALNADLLLPGNEWALRDTLLHEMAHAEAWLGHGVHGHGRVWRVIARRVGCVDSACTDVRIKRRRRNGRGAC